MLERELVVAIDDFILTNLRSGWHDRSVAVKGIHEI